MWVWARNNHLSMHLLVWVWCQHTWGSIMTKKKDGSATGNADNALRLFKAESWKQSRSDMKVTLTYDFKSRNWTSACLYPFEAGKWGSVRWKMSSLCNWLHWHSQETNWRILHFKTARPAPFNAKGDLCSTHSAVAMGWPVGGTLTLLKPLHYAMLSTCRVIVNH